MGIRTLTRHAGRHACRARPSRRPAKPTRCSCRSSCKARCSPSRSPLLGCLLAVVAGVARRPRPACTARRPLRWLATIYVEIFRGTSALVQLFWLFFVLPQFGVTARRLHSSPSSASASTSAPTAAEVVRGAILGVAARPVGGVDRAQHDAGRRCCAASSCRRPSSR